MSNVIARVGAMASLAVSTLLIARLGGPEGVGFYALLRVLPGLMGVLMSGGLPGAVSYFLGGSERGNVRLCSTILATAITGGTAAAALWVAVAPLLTAVFFKGGDGVVIAWAGAAVFAKLLVATVKSCSQGSDDLHGANRSIVLEELMFLPAFAVFTLAGLHGSAAVVASLVAADISTAGAGWTRLVRRGFFAGGGRPSLALARRIASYGIRGQVGGLLTLLNLRLDFALLGALAGPGVLGTYAVASKFADLLRLGPLAFTYVLYPRFARRGRDAAAADARALLPRVGVATALAGLPLAVAATIFLPLIYGEAFRPAIVPTYLLLLGLSGEGFSSVVTAFLYGSGRPGLNSVAMGAGLVVTVVLDLLLIPRFGAFGAAAASCVAYVTSCAVLLSTFWLLNRPNDLSGAPVPATGGTR